MRFAVVLYLAAMFLIALGVGLVWAARSRKLGGGRRCPNPDCRRRNEPHADFCAHCGRPLTPRTQD